MNHQRPAVLSYIAKTIILVLYVSFFIVQLFFNFDITNNSRNATFFSLHKNVAAEHRLSIVTKADTAKGKRQTVRLNKRFKPNTILAYTLFDIKSPACYLETKSFVFDRGIFIPSSFLLPQFFRGPPVVA